MNGYEVNWHIVMVAMIKQLVRWRKDHMISSINFIINLQIIIHSMIVLLLMMVFIGQDFGGTKALDGQPMKLMC